MRSLIVVVAIVSMFTAASHAMYGSNTQEVLDAINTLTVQTAGTSQANSYIAHFCLVTYKMIKEDKRGWYSIAKDDYIQLKKDLNSDDLSKYKDAFLAFESVFYAFNGN